MPFALLIVGTVLLISGIRGTSGDLYKQLKTDFTGDNNFLYWLGAMLVIGGLGYIQKLRPLSRAFMALVVLVLFLSNKGFFKQFVSQFFKSSSASTTSSTSSSSDTTDDGTAL